MAISRCPGMNPANFRPSDIKLRKCLECGEEMEFWKDDIRVACRKCGHMNFNPDIGNTCLVWCKSAAKCLGSEDINDWLQKQGKKRNGS